MSSRSFNIPNLLSLSRILLAPFVMVLLLYTRVGRGIPILRPLGLDLTYSDLANLPLYAFLWCFFGFGAVEMLSASFVIRLIRSPCEWLSI